MLFTLPIAQFTAALRAAVSAVPARSTLAILESALLDFTETDVQITGSDLTVAVVSHAPAKGGRPIGFCVPARRLLALITELDDGDIVLEADIKARRVTITAGGGVYVLPASDHKDYPSFAEIMVAGESLSIDGEAMRGSIDHVLHAVSTDELRPAMQGVHFKIGGDAIVLVATDGHRLSECATNSIKTAKDTKFTVPTRAIKLVRALLGAEKMKITYGKGAASFAQGGLTIFTRLVEEDYPNYESLFPDDGKNVLTVNRKALLASLARVRMFSNSLTHQVRIRLGKEVSLRAEDIDGGGEARETVDGAYTGDAMEVGFNGTYLADALKAIIAERVVFTLTTAARTALLTPVGDGERARSLVMPVRLNAQ